MRTFRLREPLNTTRNSMVWSRNYGGAEQMKLVFDHYLGGARPSELSETELADACKLFGGAHAELRDSMGPRRKAAQEAHTQYMIAREQRAAKLIAVVESYANEFDVRAALTELRAAVQPQRAVAMEKVSGPANCLDLLVGALERERQHRAATKNERVATLRAQLAELGLDV
jgi:hypothetical protein